jgi:predicted DNA repair protein MutK
MAGGLVALVGIAAMLWVGGHILLINIGEAGFHWPADQLHHLEHWGEELVHGWFGGVLSWVLGTAASAIIGLIVGAIIVAIMHVVPKRKKKDAAAH